ncbi:low-specificity L-threonine aldolase [Salinibacillus xinjiangensis]|uniref:Low-specificity L-threonine aldolase n=1 Tax=Salinibacillus xinjiangensis TaxID=1229268 RepID=A0A6G1X5Z2_9BACI|nr:low-specificity L-threonine aldolase [Salinibacillus xinjiangensis]MRG86325.1 low-specificity L-threonine aldolase [Salinibacillus xinjiangensis]
MIDLRSDTVTKPTEKMRQASYNAEVGDDVYGEDPSVHKLEEKAAELLGKESALFVTSGTQGNQIAVLTHCSPGNEIILEENAHIYMYEGAAISAFAGVQPRTLKGHKGAMDPSEVQATIRPEDIHFPETGLICLENTHNKAGGAVLPFENMKGIYQIAKNHHVPVHLDGARLFNAAVSSGISVGEYAGYTDTVQICLSKGLGAPVGSIIAGSKSFIQQARKWRKRLGGGLRQVGVIAEPGYIALTEMVERLSEDHKHAEVLAEGLANMEGLKVENKVETNIVLINVEDTGHNAESFLTALQKEGVLAVPFGPNTVRFVTHYDVSGQDIDRVIKKVNDAVSSQLTS